MKKLQDTSIFALLDTGDKYTKVINKISYDMYRYDTKKLDLDLNQIARRFNYPLKTKALVDVDTDKIRFVHSNSLDLPSMLPFIGKLENREPIMYINLTEYMKLSDNDYSIDYRKLYALIQGAYINKQTLLNFKAISMNVNIAKSLATVYAKMVVKVLDKLYAVNLNRILYDKLIFLAAKFFLIYHLERTDNDTTYDLAYRCTVNDTTDNTIRATNDAISPDSYSSIESFIRALSDEFTELNGLKFRSFLENYMKLYGSSTVLGLEYLPLFLHTIYAAMMSSHINNDFIIEPLAGREITMSYNELSRII